MNETMREGASHEFARTGPETAGMEASARAMGEIRPHDLLLLAAPPAPKAQTLRWLAPDAPAWVDKALARAPFVVVRRAPRLNDAIPVGVRGATRSERFGTWIDARRIAAIVTPEALLAREPQAQSAHLPAFELLRAIRPVIEATGLAFGPTGSTGFELASGARTVTAASDLDIVIRAPSPLSRSAAAALFDTLSHAAETVGTRIDVQIETPAAAFSLAEYARANLRVMLRYADGARLASDPWSAA